MEGGQWQHESLSLTAVFECAINFVGGVFHCIHIDHHLQCKCESPLSVRPLNLNINLLSQNCRQVLVQSQCQAEGERESCVDLSFEILQLQSVHVTATAGNAYGDLLSSEHQRKNINVKHFHFSCTCRMCGMGHYHVATCATVHVQEWAFGAAIREMLPSKVLLYSAQWQ